jgi:hypothetical protein
MLYSSVYVLRGTLPASCTWILGTRTLYRAVDSLVLMSVILVVEYKHYTFSAVCLVDIYAPKVLVLYLYK